MRVADSLEPSPFPSLEVLWPIYDRKLCAVLGLSRVVFGESIDKVIKRGPHVVRNLPDDDAQHERRLGAGEVHEFSRLAGRLRFEIQPRGLALFVDKGVTTPPEISKVFLCPIEPSEGVIKRMGHEVCSAYGKEAANAEGPRNPDLQAQRLSPRPEESRRAGTKEVTPPPPEEVASKTKPARQRGGYSATRT